jgi:hypothetical protein
VPKGNRPLPLPNSETEPFWQGCARGELLLQRCRSCQAYRHPPSPVCPRCWAPEHDWVKSSGRGKVYTYVVVHHQFREWGAEVPYVTAVVELEEGPRIVTNVVGVPPDQVKIGMPVAVSFEKVSEEIFLPLFRPIEP